MGCHYLIVPGEIIFDHLASKDKTYASVEGARTFDFVNEWLKKEGRF